MGKVFNLLTTNIISKIEENDFTVDLEGGGRYRFGKYSSEGQDFSFVVDIGNTYKELATNILEYYYTFDPSAEAYLWLDDTGHGKNGAPYEMIDVYNDMVECRGFIYDLYEIVKEFC